MTVWLDTLRRALDSSYEPIEFFFRDDDVGWDDKRLRELLDCFDRFQVSLDLAVIPVALTNQLARELRSRIAESGQIRIHQHGFAHANHELLGRKCEFGFSRSRLEQFEDIRKGKTKLQEMLDGAVDPIFTPPWNRCTERTAECLVELGFSILSRDATAEPFDTPVLAELPIQVDWFGKAHGHQLTREQLGESFAHAVRTRHRVGLMLHHQLMDADERAVLEQLFEVVTSHKQVRCLHMHQVSEAGSSSLLGRQR